MFHRKGRLYKKIQLHNRQKDQILWIETRCGCVYTIRAAGRENENGNPLFFLNSINGENYQRVPKNLEVSIAEAKTKKPVDELILDLDIIFIASDRVIKDKHHQGHIQRMGDHSKKETTLTGFGFTTLQVSKKEAVEFLHQISYIAQYEPKVSLARVFTDDKDDGQYRIMSGHFFLIPWKGKFRYHLTHCGFRSFIVEGGRGVDVYGGFLVKSLDENSCAVSHDENYCFSIWQKPLFPLIRAYVNWSIKKELHDLKLLVEAKK